MKNTGKSDGKNFLGKIINDSSKAVSAVVEAGSEATETASDLFIETNENMKEGLKT